MIEASPAAGRGLSKPYTAAAGAIFAVQLWMIFAHAAWFDETQALLIARAPWSDLLTNLRYEGHPALWYLLLGSIDRVMGGSPLALPVAEALVATGLTALIWLKAPLPSWAKLLLALNYYVIFEYGVISRSYGLAALLIMAAVTYRRTIWGWVLLALAANVAAHFTVAAVFVGGLMFLERRSFAGPAIFALGCALAVATVYPKPHDLQLASPILASHDVRMLINLQRLSAIVLPDAPLLPLSWAHALPFPWGLPLGLLGFAIGPFMLRTWPARLGYVALFAALLALGVMVYQLWPRHIGALVIYAVAATWMRAEREPEERLSKVFVGWLALLAFCGVFAAGSALVKPFTRYPEIARWIVAHHLQGEAWGGWPGNYGGPLAVLLDRPIINAQKGCAETFTRWNYNPQDEDHHIGRVRASGARYVLSDRPLPLAPIARFGSSLMGHPMVIYDFGPPIRPTVLCANH